MGSGLRPLASPTARTAAGRPIVFAMSPYERVSPYGIFIKALHTACWKGVPFGCSWSSNAVRFPWKYSRSCRSAPRNGAADCFHSGFGAIAPLPHWNAM